jgi:glycosyltransferase involved in cell wall biosynthesis
VLDLGRRPGVEVTGRVPQTPPWFDRAAVAVAPLRLARGVQNKVLEAMSMALPVVTSPQAAQGLGAVPEDTLVVADGAGATAAAVIALLEDPARARAIGARAAAFVRQRFRWERMYERLDELIERLLPPTPLRRDAGEEVAAS